MLCTADQYLFRERAKELGKIAYRDGAEVWDNPFSISFDKVRSPNRNCESCILWSRWLLGWIEACQENEYKINPEISSLPYYYFGA